MAGVNNLFDFIRKSPSSYHAVEQVKDRLLENGFTELYEGDNWTLSEAGRYFVRRNGSSLVAFIYREQASGFNIVASHSDSPSFKVKSTAEAVGAYTRLEVEKYGGMIYYSWLDRPLSVAGRVLVATESGLCCKLVNIDRELLTIPSLAIHLNRGVNDSFKLNPAKDMLPLYSGAAKTEAFMCEIAKEAGVSVDRIAGHDLFLYNRDRGCVFGEDGEFILCPRLDDLECVYSSVEAFLSAEEAALMPVLAIFDNEEVGSETKQGAASTLLDMSLQRIAGTNLEYYRLLAGSFMVSADNAHAKHPNSPEMSDPNNAPIINGGIVIKFNANQRYATDGASFSVFEQICKRAGVKTQIYYNRADLPGGSTLGSISGTKVSIPAVDIGFAQLAMHSANETAGAYDICEMIKALRAFYSTPIRTKGGEIIF